MPSAAAARRQDHPAPIARLAVAQPCMPDLAALSPYLRRIDEAGWYSNFGPLVTGLEQRLAARFRRPTAIATLANGTLGLTLGLQAMGLRPGGLCAVPSWTFVATVHAVLQAGLTPWFVDVDPETWMLDPVHLQSRLAGAPAEVVAAIPVSAFGRMPDLNTWAAFRARTGVQVLVDAAAAFDAVDVAPVPVMVSLHATKVLGVGEGGFVACEDGDLIQAIRERTSFGFRGTREAMVAATNAKMSEYAAAVGMAALDLWPTTRRRYAAAAQRLRMALVDTPDVSFQRGWGTAWVSSTCVVGLAEGSAGRAEAALARAGLDTRRWWGDGCHRCAAFADLPCDDLRVTERLAGASLGAPYSAAMAPADIDRVAGALRSAAREG